HVVAWARHAVLGVSLSSSWRLHVLHLRYILALSGLIGNALFYRIVLLRHNLAAYSIGNLPVFHGVQK
ncbi:hypothetical protein KPG66_07040, partial [Mycetohabitans sp. B2]|uniref:hypothetical protein n=1 Tax=Mycetohabitans sp. B2 TaxID=2841274 RepID=UPI001F403C77